MRRLKFLAAMFLALPSGCGGRGDSVVDVTVVGQPDAPFISGGRLTMPGQLLRSATAEGLVSLDEQARVTSAVADRWIVTDDGLSYIFRLRDGDWPDGSPITAESARSALRQAIAATRGTPLAVDLEPLNDIRVMTARVIEVRLERPHPELLQLLAQPELGLEQKDSGSGPMSLHRSGAVAVLEPIPPEARGLPAVRGWKDRARRLRLRAEPAAAAVERFNRGETDIVLGGRIDTFPITDAVGISRGAIKLEPVSGVFGLVAVHADGFLSLAANREAIAMAIDRDALFDAFSAGGWVASNRLISDDVDDAFGLPGERWSGQTLAARQAIASARVWRWKGMKGKSVRLRIALPNGPGSDRIFAHLATDLQHVGLQTERVGESDVADLRMVDSVARYPRALWYLNQFNCKVQRGLCDPEADEQVAAADSSSDASERKALLGKAVADFTAANIFIPFGPPLRWSLVAGDATGFVANRLAYHPLMSLALRPK